MRVDWRHHRELLLVAAGLFAAAFGGSIMSGCISKATARAQARAAFVAGEQQAMQNMELLRNRGPTVTVVGEVKNNLVPWTNGLTLGQAMVDAQYFGDVDPKQILVVREGRATPYDPKQLLKGEDVPLEPRDVVVIKR